MLHTDGKMLGEWKQAFSLPGCAILDNSAKSSLLPEKNWDGLFLSSLIALFPREGRGQRASSQRPGPFHPGPPMLPVLRGSFQAPWEGLWVSSNPRLELINPGVCQPLQTKQICFQSLISPEHFILVKSLSCPNSLTAKTTIIYLQEGRCRLQLGCVVVVFFGSSNTSA